MRFIREFVGALLVAGMATTGLAGAVQLKGELEALREKFKVPAIGYAVVLSNEVVALEVAGVRKHGVGEPVTKGDKWHHGSLTKSMTATLAGILVEQGVLQWRTTVGEVFPEIAKSMHEEWRTVTLEQLLSHRAGAPGELTKSDLWSRLWNHGGTPLEQRLFLVKEVTTAAPESKPGTAHKYSNAGFAIAGAMMERVTNTPWEKLITEKLFKPLGMTSAGFGPPATPRYIDEPWGHRFRDGKPSPIESGRDADNPPSIGPGGTVHCTLEDMAKYISFHVAGARGEGKLLKKETFEKLHRDVQGQGYALGWGVSKRTWAGGRTLQHTGSNNQWYTNVWLAPEKNFAVVVVTNVGGDEAFKCTDAMIGKVIERVLKK